ncbi:gp46 [Alphaproteobacteria phage PhiJL001]|uniref:Gp46 n=1 Tax=Alphaproteobacteria phage PhiJL001 TaxID=2681607 RepID=Q5DN59_9CAUD|nr:gp46 [Alphaproteobacteria phage PhiJL001]AAT69522.1 gp46 [Alphaproteobacteria phage PhiJL001]
MSDWEWEQWWRTRGFPELGDYIQVAFTWKVGGEKGVQEGFVTSINGDYIGLNGESGDPDKNAYAWRKRIVPSKEKEREEIVSPLTLA